MKIRLRDLKRLLHERLLLEDGGANLGQLLDNMASQFAAKMSSTYPQAGDEVIKREAADLKTQLTATIKAAAAKVKMASSGGGEGGGKKFDMPDVPRERYTGQV